MNIDGASILVTGGAGLIGSATIDLLLAEHDPGRIVILDNLSRGSLANLKQALEDRRVRFLVGDVRDPRAVRAATEGADAVLHLAALRITACAAQPREAMDVMCNGSFNVVEAARDEGVQRIVAASSASIYGMADTFPTTEAHHSYNNRTWYGASKVMLEGLLRSFHEMYGMPYVAMRYFNVYGPRMDVEGKYTEVLIRWMERIASGQPPLILGDGTQTMDFVYIDDVARANLLALQADVADEAFNVASGTETSLEELARELMSVMGRDMEPEYGPERSVNAVRRRLADVRKAERMLGFRSRVRLRDGLSRLVVWWSANRASSESRCAGAAA